MVIGTAVDLHAEAPEQPDYLNRRSKRVAQTNSPALRVVAINSASPDPAGGPLQWNEHDDLTGTLFEGANKPLAIDISEHAPPQLTQALKNRIN